MKASSARFFYDLIFWGVVCGLVYFNRHLYKAAETSLEPIFQAYTTVILILIGLAVFFLIVYLREAIVNTAMALAMQVTGGNPLNYEKGNLHANIRKSAHRLEKKGNFQEAGEAYESLEMWREAAMVYERGNLYGRAAAAWQAEGSHGKAIELYEKDRNFTEAARLCLNEGLQDRAFKNFRIAGDRCLEENQFGPAADFYEKAHDFDKAGAMFENAHKTDRALFCYEKASNTAKILQLLREISPTEYHRRGPDFTELIKRSAESLANSGSPSEAAKVLEDCNDFVRAAEIYSGSKEWDKASQLYLKAGRKELAQAAIEKITEPRIAADLSAQLAVSNSDWQRAGEHFEAAGKQNQAIDAFKKVRNFDAAARIYESMGRYIMAGEMYSSGKNLVAAANAYAKAYDWRNAAECFEASGDTAQAIEAYSNAGNFLKAGTLAIKVTDYARAIEYLQRIPSASPDFRFGTAFLATAFYYQCHYDMSSELFNRVMDDFPLNKDTVPVYYAYAGNIQAENPKKSLGLFRQILGVDVHYSDVADRVQKLEKIVTSMSTGFGNNTPISTIGGSIARQTPLPATDTPFPLSGISTLATTRSTLQNDELKSYTPVPAVLKDGVKRSDIQPSLLEGRYQLQELLTHTGRIKDYRASDILTKKNVFVRTFPKPENVGLAQQSLTSLGSLTHLSHPGINPVISYGETQGMIFVIYPELYGSSLRQRIRTKGPMTIKELKLFCNQALSILGYAHSQGQVHKTLTPDLFYLRDNLADQIMITGFGSPNRETESSESMYLTVPDSDPQFLAPEQIIGTEIDARTDIYTMGLIIFFVLTGRTPFEVKRINDTQEIARMQVQISLTKPSTIRATLPSAADEIFQKCVTKSASQRYQTTNELLEEIEALLQTQATS